MANRFLTYLSVLPKPHLNVARLEFLQPDGSVAFALDGIEKRGYSTRYDTRAFLQGGSVSVSLNNGIRRRANITLANLDGAFDFSFNKLWFGSRVRLSMGVSLPGGTPFYLPQGVFYLDSPAKEFKPGERSVSYSLVDKWGYLDGSLFGKLEGAYSIPKTSGGQNVNVFNAMRSLLRLSKIDFKATEDISLMIDPEEPLFTNYYNGKTYALSGGGYADMTDLPFDITSSPSNGTIAGMLLELNTVIAGIIGYDAAGRLRVLPSQDDISDADKPVLYAFTPENSFLSGLSESAKIADVYNDVLIVGTGLSGYDVYGRASIYNPASDTNIYRIGKRTYREEKATYWNEQQCRALALYTLKKKVALKKSITVTCPPVYHLAEDSLITVKRTDKPGAPVERHLIESFTLPISQTGTMSINAVSVNDLRIAN